MASFATQISSKELQRFTRFLTVGAVGTFLDFGLLSLLEAFSLPTLIANSLSFSAGVATASPGTVCGFLQMQCKQAGNGNWRNSCWSVWLSLH